jgi:uncharacterized membrane protein
MSDSSTAAAGATRLPRWLLPVLVASLAANLIVAGAVLGQRWRSGGEVASAYRGGPDSEAEAGQRTLRRVSPERRQEMRRIFESHRGSFRGQWQEVKRAREQVQATLSAEPFDRQAYVSSMQRYLDIEVQARKSVQPMYADIAATLSPEERRDFLRGHRHLRRVIVGKPEDGGGGPPGRRQQ